MCNQHYISKCFINAELPGTAGPAGMLLHTLCLCSQAQRHKSDRIHIPVSAKTTGVASHLSNARGARGRTLPSIRCQCSICASDSDEKWLFVFGEQKRGGVDYSPYLSLSKERSRSISGPPRTCHRNSLGFTIFQKVKVSVVRNRRITGRYSLE